MWHFREGGVRTYSDLSYIFSGGSQDSGPPTTHDLRARYHVSRDLRCRCWLGTRSTWRRSPDEPGWLRAWWPYDPERRWGRTRHRAALTGPRGRRCPPRRRRSAASWSRSGEACWPAAARHDAGSSPVGWCHRVSPTGAAWSTAAWRLSDQFCIQPPSACLPRNPRTILCGLKRCVTIQYNTMRRDMDFHHFIRTS